MQWNAKDEQRINVKEKRRAVLTFNSQNRCLGSFPPEIFCKKRS